MFDDFVMCFVLSIRPSVLDHEIIKTFNTVTDRCNFKDLSVFCGCLVIVRKNFNADVKKCNTTCLWCCKVPMNQN